MGTVQVYAQDGSSVELADDEDTDDEELKLGEYTYVLDEDGNAILTGYNDETATEVTVPGEIVLLFRMALQILEIRHFKDATI